MTDVVKSPAGQEFYETVCNEIRKGVLVAGQSLAGIRQVSQRFEIGARVARAVLARLKQEGWVDSAPGKGTRVVGVPADLRTEPTASKAAVLVKVDAGGAAMAARILSSFKRHARQSGMSVDEVEYDRNEPLAGIRREPGQTLILISIDNPKPFYSLGFPGVVASHFLPGDAWELPGNFDLVMPDDLQGGASVGRYFAERGMKDVYLVGKGAMDAGTPTLLAELRFRGFERGFGQAIPPERRLLGRADVPCVGAEIAQKILGLKRLPQAIFASTDDLAEGLCSAFLGQGLKPGADILVAGFDGNQSLRGFIPPVPSVEADLEEIGRLAAILARERAEDPARVPRKALVGCRLINLPDREAESE